MPFSRTRKSRHPVLLEPLEPRTLLTGLTIITHGAEFFSSDRPGWLDTMGAAIRARVGPDTAIYTLRVEPNGTGGVGVTSMARIAGPVETASSNGENILLLDWAAAAAVGLGSLQSDYSTALVANAVIPWLLTPRPGIGLTAPLVEGPIQIIGHSRGASLASVLATDLGMMGIWVDQLTTLDPVPVPPDPAVSMKPNIIFADNYYQKSGDGLFTPNGTAITGAYNLGPLGLGGAYPAFDGATHSDVHLFYYGTINLANGATDGAHSVQNSWYTLNHTRANTGWYISRLGGGPRPTAGIGKAFGGTGARGILTHAGTQWANIAMISLPELVAVGEPFAAGFFYNTMSTSAAIQWFLDTDTNPYNGNSVALGSAINVAATGDKVVHSSSNITINAALGTYYLEARISNATGSRYSYTSAFDLQSAPPVATYDDIGPAVFDGWVADPDSPATSLDVQLNVDGTAFGTMTADLPHANLPVANGSAHGFSFDLTTLTPGIHRVDFYATDTTSGQPILILSQTISNNRPPVGSLEAFDGSTFSGWASDPEAGATPIQILYQVDNNAPVVVNADQPRLDMVDPHGFSVTLPQLTAGNHTVTVSAIDSTSKTLTQLGTMPASVFDPADNFLATGHLDSATTTRVIGWAADASNPGVAINVRVDIDGVAGTPMVAKLNRLALKNQIGSINHGFSIPIKLTPGQHRVDVYAIDDQGTPVLLGSRIVKTSKPVGGFNTFTATTMTGWAYGPGVPNTLPTIRVDVDGVAGVAFVTNVLRPDINAARHLTGTYGFSISTPVLTPGTHVVKLEYLDPLTMAVTSIITKSLVTT